MSLLGSHKTPWDLVNITSNSIFPRTKPWSSSSTLSPFQCWLRTLFSSFRACLLQTKDDFHCVSCRTLFHPFPILWPCQPGAPKSLCIDIANMLRKLDSKCKRPCAHHHSPMFCANHLWHNKQSVCSQLQGNWDLPFWIAFFATRLGTHGLSVRDPLAQSPGGLPLAGMSFGLV